MGKGKRPRKPKPPTPDQSEELERPSQAKGELGPLARRPPTAVGTDTLAPPARPVLYELLQTIRSAVGAMLDIADAAADAITKRLEGRA